MTATLTTDHLHWMIETADEAGAEMNIPFTGTYDEARSECHRFHPGATITACR